MRMLKLAIVRDVVNDWNFLLTCLRLLLDPNLGSLRTSLSVLPLPWHA